MVGLWSRVPGDDLSCSGKSECLDAIGIFSLTFYRIAHGLIVITMIMYVFFWVALHIFRCAYAIYTGSMEKYNIMAACYGSFIDIRYWHTTFIE